MVWDEPSGDDRADPAPAVALDDRPPGGIGPLRQIRAPVLRATYQIDAAMAHPPWPGKAADLAGSVQSEALLQAPSRDASPCWVVIVWTFVGTAGSVVHGGRWPCFNARLALILGDRARG